MTYKISGSTNFEFRPANVDGMIPIRRVLFPPPLRRPIGQALRQQPLPRLRFYSISLQPTEYHRVADDTMDKLTVELENLLEENDLAGSDVEYSVLDGLNHYSHILEWSSNSQTWQTRNVCNQ